MALAAAAATILPFLGRGVAHMARDVVKRTTTSGLQKISAKHPLISSFGQAAVEEVMPDEDDDYILAPDEPIPIQDSYSHRQVHSAVRHVGSHFSRISGRNINEPDDYDQMPRRHGSVHMDDVMSMHRSSQYKPLHDKYFDMRQRYEDRQSGIDEDAEPDADADPEADPEEKIEILPTYSTKPPSNLSSLKLRSLTAQSPTTPAPVMVAHETQTVPSRKYGSRKATKPVMVTEETQSDPDPEVVTTPVRRSVMREQEMQTDPIIRKSRTKLPLVPVQQPIAPKKPQSLQFQKQQLIAPKKAPDLPKSYTIYQGAGGKTIKKRPITTTTTTTPSKSLSSYDPKSLRSPGTLPTDVFPTESRLPVDPSAYSENEMPGIQLSF